MARGYRWLFLCAAWVAVLAVLFFGVRQHHSEQVARPVAAVFLGATVAAWLGLQGTRLGSRAAEWWHDSPPWRREWAGVTTWMWVVVLVAIIADPAPVQPIALLFLATTWVVLSGIAVIDGLRSHASWRHERSQAEELAEERYWNEIAWLELLPEERDAISEAYGSPRDPRLTVADARERLDQLARQRAAKSLKRPFPEPWSPSKTDVVRERYRAAADAVRRRLGRDWEEVRRSQAAQRASTSEADLLSASELQLLKEKSAKAHAYFSERYRSS